MTTKNGGAEMRRPLREFGTNATTDLLRTRHKGRMLPAGQAYLARAGHIEQLVQVLEPVR